MAVAPAVSSSMLSTMKGWSKTGSLIPLNLLTAVLNVVRSDESSRYIWIIPNYAGMEDITSSALCIGQPSLWMDLF